MILMTKCDVCLRRHACDTRIKEFKNTDFSNIIINVGCKSYMFTTGLAGNYNSDKLIFKEKFDHCDTCDFSLKCKYYKHENMLKEIDRVTTLCCNRGCDNIQYTCKLYRSIEPQPDEEYIPVSPEKKKFKFFSRKKED